MTRPGRLITFEGGEGAGKSTQIRRLAATLGAAGLDVMTTREPGGTVGAESIRRLLVSGPAGRWLPATEMLLHMAARHDHVTRSVAPALDAGRIVLCDRFVDSTRVYQGVAGGVGLDRVDELHRAVLGGLEADLTLILDVPPPVGLARSRRTRGEDRYERMPPDFHERVRQGFLMLAGRAPERRVVIDATADVEHVTLAVHRAVAGRLGLPCDQPVREGGG